MILYGSRARGTAQQGSDWDLLLLTEKERLKPDDEKKLRMPVFLQELAVGQAFSLQIFNLREWHSKYRSTPYYENIQQEGILL